MPRKVPRLNTKALYAALDTQRAARGLTWAQVARETGVAAATITRTKQGGRLEVDGMLAMVQWLDRSVESFIGRTRPAITAIAPFFIVRDVPKSMAFYRDKLGFEITFEGPEPNDIFFGIVQRGGAFILMKAIGVEPVPNYTRDIKQGIARWDAYVSIPDPDALAAEFASRGVNFFLPLQDTEDGLRGFEIQDSDGYLLFFGRVRS